jgi:putative thioredoxin
LIARARDADPQNPRVRLAEAGVEVGAGNFTAAQALLDALPMELVDDPEVTMLRGQILFAGMQANSPPESELITRLAADESDSDARYRLAAHLVARGDYEGALEQLLDLMTKDRSFEDDAGRKGMLAVFAMLGGDGELVTRYRGKMLNALY